MKGGNALKVRTFSKFMCSLNTSKKMKYWDNKENVNILIQKLRTELNLISPKDWNNLTKKQIRTTLGGSLSEKYSIYEIKCMGCPEGKLLFKQPISYKPQGYWENIDNVKIFLNELKEKMNLNSINDWNKVSAKNILKYGGGSLLEKYSLFDLKLLGCPEGKLIYKKTNKPVGFWDKKENIEDFIKELRDTYGLKTPKDWNSILRKQIISLGGNGLLNKLSLYQIKILGCPEGKLIYNQPIPSKPVGFWNNQQNVENFLNDIKQKLDLKTIEDWNSVTAKQIHSYGGGSLFVKYSMYDLKCMACPEGKDFFDNPKKPGYWNKVENVYKFLELLRHKLQLKTPEDWNLLHGNDLILLGGSRLLKKYSMYELKCMACPEGNLLFKQPEKRKLPGFWKNPENVQSSLDMVANELNLNSNEDWERTSKAQIFSVVGSGLNKANVPQISNKKFIGRSSQRWLFLQVQKIFPGEEIVEDYFHSAISRKTGSPVQFDIFIVKKDIAFEYHGLQHYEDIAGTGFGPLEMYQSRDREKEILCSQFGVQLIVIPYWWDNTLESLKATLKSKIEGL